MSRGLLVLLKNYILSVVAWPHFTEWNSCAMCIGWDSIFLIQLSLMEYKSEIWVLPAEWVCKNSLMPGTGGNLNFYFEYRDHVTGWHLKLDPLLEIICRDLPSEVRCASILITLAKTFCQKVSFHKDFRAGVKTHYWVVIVASRPIGRGWSRVRRGRRPVSRGRCSIRRPCCPIHLVRIIVKGW